jgi:hypothetical protein
MKKLLSIFMVLGLWSAGYSQTCPTPTTTGVHITLDSTYQTGKYSAGFTDVGLCFYNSSSENITAVQFRMFYDNQAFSGVDTVTSKNTTFSQYLQYVDNPTSGYVTITLTYTGTLSTFDIPDGALFNVKLNHTSALATTYFTISDLSFVGSSSFTQTATKQSGDDYSLNLTNFGGEFLSQKFSFKGKFVNVTGTAAKSVTVALEKKLKTSSTWSQVTSQQAGTDGRFAFNDVAVDTSAWNVRIKVQGDTIFAGNVVSTADAQRVNQYVLGTQTMTGFDFYSSDVNGDKKVTISDVYGIYARVSGRFTSWPNSVQDVKFFTVSEYNAINGSTTSQQTTYPGVTNFTFDIVAGQPDSVTYYVLASGDANGTGFKRARLVPIEIVNPNNAFLHIIDVTTEYDNNLPKIEVNFPQLGVDEGNIVRVPVKLKTNGTTLGSLQLAMKYDSDLLEFVTIKNELKSSYWMSFINTNGNEVEWGGYDPSNNQNLINDGEILFTLEFVSKRTQTQWNKSPLYVTRKFAGDRLAKDLIITPTDGILQIFKVDPTNPISFDDMMVYPNPTTDITKVSFKIYEKSDVSLGIYDMGGKQCIQVLNGTYPVGIYTTTVDLGMLSPGEYVAILRKEDEVVAERATVIK